MSEVDRFWSHIIKGPEPDDCWLWMGAVSDDGYGRFWTHNGLKQKVVRPQRYAYEVVTGQPLPHDAFVLHSCDVPICVHADPAPSVSHLRAGTHRQNMLDRSERGRAPNGATSEYSTGRAKAMCAQRSRDLQRMIKENGWDRDQISAIRFGIDPSHPRLF